MNSEQCLNDIYKILFAKYKRSEEIWIDALSELNRSFTITYFNFLLYDFVNFPKIIPIQRDRGLFNLKVPSEDSEAYRAIVSPEGYISCDNVDKYLSSQLTRSSKYSLYEYNYRYDNSNLSVQLISNGSCVTFPILPIIPSIKLPLSQWPFSDPPVPAEVRNKFPWYAIPWKNEKNNDDRIFSVRAPEWEEELLNQEPKSIKILCLMNRLRKQHYESLPKLTYYMLKTVVLNQLPIINWKRDWVSLLSEMWTRLADNLRAGRLDSFLVDGLNLLDGMDSKELKQCVATTQKILFQILEARYNNTREDAEKLFGIDLNKGVVL